MSTTWFEPVATGCAGAETAEPGRLEVVDILRGIALLGMMIVHFTWLATDPQPLSRAASAYWFLAVGFLEERFWAMFGILFGVGFALQLLRRESRHEPVVGFYIRRLLVLFLFGFIAEAVFGFNVLMAYAVWGLPLLLVRRWPVRALVAAAVLCAASGSLYSVGRAVHGVATVGEAEYRAQRGEVAARVQVHRQENAAAQKSESYAAVLQARLRNMPWFYTQPFSLLPGNTFTLFLLGLIGFRLGLFTQPERHRRLIVLLMAFGLAASVSSYYVPTASLSRLGSPLTQQLVLALAKRGFGLLRGMWLAFTYIGAVLLIASYRTSWLRGLRPFAWTGRIALSAYLLHIAAVDVALSPYGLGLQLSVLQLLAASIAAYGMIALGARWWLARYRYGPLEWLWRSAAYARWEPMRRTVTRIALVPSI